MKPYIVLLLALSLILSACSAKPGFSPQETYPPDNKIPPNQPTPLPGTPLLPTAIPAIKSTPELSSELPSGAEIQELMWFSHTRWQSLWLEAQIIQYDPNGMQLPESNTMLQIWINQPAQVRLVSGSLNSSPNRLWVSDGRNYRESGSAMAEMPPYVLDPFYAPPISPTDTIYPFPIAGMLGTPFGDLIFSTPLAQRGGTFTVIRNEIYLNRAAVVVEWGLQPGGALIDRLWVDAQTGVILRKQNFTKGGDQPVSSDMFVTEIFFDVVFAENTFFVNALVPEDFASDYNEAGQ